MDANVEMNVNAADIDALLASMSEAEAAEAAAEEAREEDVEPVAISNVVEFDEEALLADLKGFGADDQELDDDALAVLEETVARAESYQTQTSDANIDPAKPAPKKAEKKERKPKAAGTPRVARQDLADLPYDVFQLNDGDTIDSVSKSTTIARRPSQVKIAEKFDNLFQAIAAGKEPSRYVVLAFKLFDQRMTITSADIMGAYKAAGLGDGTASSQTGQVMALFATAGIALRSGQALTLLPGSTVARKLRAILGL